MHAFLIVSTSDSTTQKEVQNISERNNATVVPFVLQKIDEVRQLKKMASLLFSKKTAIFLENFDDATIDAQNAFSVSGLYSHEYIRDNVISLISTQRTTNGNAYGNFMKTKFSPPQRYSRLSSTSSNNPAIF